MDTRNAFEPNRKLNVLFFTTMILLFLPTWLWLGEAWLSDPYYSHGPLVVIIALYFVWARRNVIASRPERTLSEPERSEGESKRESKEAAKQSPTGELDAYAASSLASRATPLRQAQGRSGSLLATTGWLIIIAALALHLWATIWRAYYFSAMMIPIALFGLTLTIYGWHIARRFIFPFAFLILMVPLPLAERFGPTLETWTATSATLLAQWIGVAARNEGAQVFLPNSTFTVGIPCGGLHSAIAIITIATLFAYILRGAMLPRLAIFLAAIPIALAANTLRIALLFAIANTWGAGAAMNYFHDWSSPFLFIAAVVLIFATAKFLRTDQVRWEVVFPQ